MEVKWTDEQQKVIDLRDRNLLVSAAAGSGKTAVLVERIIKKITDPVNPVDIDKILVVTFTKAAAAEMKERISDKIEELKNINPEDDNLIRQSTLINNALITTIDSFCLFVVKNHFGEIDLDPDFRIGEGGEIKLMEGDTLDELFELNYLAKDNEGFTRLIDNYAKSRNDQDVRDMVMRIYHMSQSESWPIKWISRLPKMYGVTSVQELLESDIIKNIAAYVKTLINDYTQKLIKLRDITLLPDGPLPYFDTVEADLNELIKVEDIEDYQGLKGFFESYSPGNMARMSLKNLSDEQLRLKKLVQDERNDIKSDLMELKKTYFSISLSDLKDQLNRLEPTVKELVRLAASFTEMMDAKKRDKRILDFSDVEHFALKVFLDENTGERTATAIDFSHHFDEIMIDEYQDSNQIQEDILCSISTMEEGKNNMFMVGDVKQSIYRFRLARPELFMKKYHTYDPFDSKNQKIDLHMNFRSRAEVLDFSNDIFYKIMHADMGGVEYDSDAALYLGADFPEDTDKKAEILLIDKKDEDLAEIVEEEGSKFARVEALAVAQKIKDMMGTMQIKDKKSKLLRPIMYRDIVLLFRSRTNCQEFINVLSECDIPAHMESQSGYFDAYEVQVVLNMLRILDNPYQDIPMTVVLKSAIVGLDEEELAEIRVMDKDRPFSSLVVDAMATAEEGKLYDFNILYTELRSIIADTPIHEVISILLEKTGFGQYAASMPAGNRRALNLNTLIEKAINYEKTSYKGLYHFIRYIDQLHKYEVDMGEAETLGENEDVVRLLSIHKSKGLEFPVVFVCELGSKFNRSDTKGNIVLHTALGIGIDDISGDPKVKRKNLIKSEIINRIKLESLGEELRVLYVALTRAKEKLILTGCVSNADNALSNASVSFLQRASAQNYLDWIIPAVLSYPEKYDISFLSAMDLAEKEAKTFAKLSLDKAKLKEQIDNADEDLIEQFRKNFEYEYKYKESTDKKIKYSVSEYKHESMVDNYDKLYGGAQKVDFAEPEREHYIPEFIQDSGVWQSGEKVSQGALYGTAVHRIMECLDFKKILDIDTGDEKAVKDFVSSQIDAMHGSGLITDDMKAIVRQSQIMGFIKDPIALKMAAADKNGLLFNEKPFVMKYNDGLVQGIIDAFWIEDDSIYLLDYKTDSVETADELILRYKRQLDIYAEALSKAFSSDQRKLSVAQSLIYSFKLKEVVRL